MMLAIAQYVLPLDNKSVFISVEAFWKDDKSRAVLRAKHRLRHALFPFSASELSAWTGDLISIGQTYVDVSQGH